MAQGPEIQNNKTFFIKFVYEESLFRRILLDGRLGLSAFVVAESEGVCVFLERRERRAHQFSSFVCSIPAGTPAKKVLYLTPGREITAGAGVCRHCHLRHWQWRRYSSSSGAQACGSRSGLPTLPLVLRRLLLLCCCFLAVGRIPA